ncbi:MAG: hypothetical protein V1721_08945 [Pseudomonadota bacterium]
MSGTFHPAKRQTLHILGTGPDHDPNRGHLYVVLTNKCDKGLHLLVPICSKRHGSDGTCLLGTGDHGFLKNDSYVSYHHAAEWDSAVIAERIKNGDITFRGLLDEKVFALVAGGVENSLFTKPKIKSYYQNNKLK